MSLNIDELEQLARAATPGPWKLPEGSGLSGNPRVVTHDGTPVVYPWDGGGCDDNDAAFIAAANPAAILELISIVREKFAQSVVERFHHPDAAVTPVPVADADWRPPTIAPPYAINEHDGRRMPVPGNTIVDVQFYGETKWYRDRPADFWDWTWDIQGTPTGSEIVRWMINAQQPPLDIDSECGSHD